MGPEFHRAYVVSDLHLGGESGFQMFSAGARFKSLCDRVAAQTKRDHPTLLLINGDFVDFLAEPQAGYWNDRRASCYLKEMQARPPFQPVFDGLRRFVSRNGARLVIVLGNHDLELALPEVQETLLELIADRSPEIRSRIEFVTDGMGYRFQVHGATALATHGNEVDNYNFTRFDTLQQIIREQLLNGRSETALTWKPSAGTVFVIDAINRIKRQFPFVDLLKPESVTFLALVVLSPGHLTVADEFASLVATAALNERRRPASERRFLEFQDTMVRSSGSRGSALEQKVHSYIRSPHLNPDDLIYGETADELLGISDWVTSARSAVSNLTDRGIRLVSDTGDWIGRQLSQAAQATHSATLRTSLWPLISAEVPQVQSLGKADVDLLKMVVRPYDVVFTGHTHARRFVVQPQPNVNTLINTGTWAGLMRISEQDVSDDRRFRPIYDLLISGDRQQLTQAPQFCNECPVAVLEEQGQRVVARLMRVDEHNQLQPQDQHGRTYEAIIG